VHSDAKVDMTSTKESVERDRFRTTVYLTEDEITSLDELRAHFRRQERRQVDRSQLIREAIRHYHETMLTQ
jgi:metal-responsive CopG/Arc/MetJ family transcriptional regulator